MEELENKIGYSFKNKKLLEQALTHRSYRFESKEEIEIDNERLEFLGDAVLDLVVSDILYRFDNNYDEGQLSKMRAELVNIKSLSLLARSLELGKFLLIGRGEDSTGGREKESILGDAQEALIGAIYLDGGIEPLFKFVKKHFKGMLDKAPESQFSEDYKSKIQEEIQRRFHCVPQYRLLRSEGPDHQKMFLTQLLAAGEIYGEGWGKSKKESEQLAAKEALHNLGISVE